MKQPHGRPVDDVRAGLWHASAAQLGDPIEHHRAERVSGGDDFGFGNIELSLQRSDAKDVHLFPRRAEFQLHLGVAAAVGHVALRAVRVEIRPHARLERRRRVVRIDEVIEFFGWPVERRLEVTALLQPGQLVFAGIGLVRAIHLQRAKAEHEVGRPRVADHTLGPAEKTPGALPRAAGRRRVPDAELAFATLLRDEAGVSLVVVPFVGIAGPFAPLPGHQPRFDHLAAGRVVRLHLERQRLHGDRTVHELPAAGGGGIDRVVIRHCQQPRHAGAVVPAGAFTA